MSIPSRGFTIVELLVIIIIISILALLVITVFRGIQERANNTHTISVVTAYVKATKQYAVDNNKYPEGTTPGAFAASCLGTGYADDTCLNLTNGTPASCNNTNAAQSESWYNDSVKPYLQNKSPPTNMQVIRCNNITMVGGGYYANYPSAGNAAIVYFLNGNVGCGSIGGIAAVRLPTDINSSQCLVNMPGT